MMYSSSECARLCIQKLIRFERAEDNIIYKSWSAIKEQNMQISHKCCFSAYRVSANISTHHAFIVLSENILLKKKYSNAKHGEK